MTVCTMFGQCFRIAEWFNWNGCSYLNGYIWHNKTDQLIHLINLKHYKCLIYKYKYRNF